MNTHQKSEVSPATDEQLQAWVEKFSCYRHGPTKDVLCDWLNRFDADHLAIARKVLDEVVIVSEFEIHQGYKDALDSLDGWSKESSQRAGRWYFVGVGSAGESGPAMLRLFREANSMTADKWQSYFVTTKDLPRLALSALDHVVFVDDFAGTGRQMVNYWPIMEELVASEAKCYLFLTAVTEKAANEIETKTELNLRSPRTIANSANIFAAENSKFNDAEKAILLKYGKKAWPDNPKGFGECGLTLVLSHKTPNNTIPILHANHSRWKGPFPRQLIPG